MIRDLGAQKARGEERASVFQNLGAMMSYEEQPNIEVRLGIMGRKASEDRLKLRWVGVVWRAY
jgi:hypothetical protein